MLLVGRECAGVDPPRRLIVDDPSISRVHFEVRIHPTRGAVLIDMSTNGTLLNGRRVERGEPIPLHDGDLIEMGEMEFAFVAPAPVDTAHPDVSSTVRTLGAKPVVAVVGDIVGYTALSERHGAEAVGRAIDDLFAALARLLTSHHGTASNYAGDAMFAFWDAGRDVTAPQHAIRFAVEADELVDRLAADLPIRAADGEVRMGWGVTLGEAATSRPSPAREVVHGDAVNLAFRLAGVAARDGLPSVLVTEGAAAAAPSAARYGPIQQLSVKGRAAPARVRSAGRTAAA